MSKTFRTAAAFRASLEARLKRTAEERHVPLNTLRLKLVMERLLARLFMTSDPPWLLKGGYAMELRYRPRARTTKDIDLTIGAADADAALPTRLDAIREELQEAADVDLGDYLQFRIGRPQSELQGAPLGGGRFPCEALLAGKIYGRFHIDIGFGDALTGEPDRLDGDDLLAFADIAPAKVQALPRVQQFAEKIHAYTFRWTDRPNTRVKDLVDLILLIEHPMPPIADIRAALHATFAARGTHPLPESLESPPASWKADFAAMATEAQLVTTDLSAGFERLRRFWEGRSLGTTT